MSPQMSLAGPGGVRRVLPLRAWRVTAATAACAVVLTGCSGSSGGDTAATTGTSSPTSTASSPTARVDKGVTEPGTKLKLGKPAVVRFTANAKHDSLIKLTVTKVKRGKIKDLSQFRLNKQAKRSNIYYVSASVKNVGKGHLGGKPVSLYGQVSHHLVVPPVIFGSTFKRCNYQPLPDKFGPGRKADMCIVMLAAHHGKVSAVQWRPADNSDAITWIVR